jgi:S-adenosylmethionine:tRNA ribosyltransferase-isomerase
MRLSDFDYELPSELIAQEPAGERDGSRLLVLQRGPDRLEHRRFSDLPEYLRAGDVLVVNDTKVIPARLFGTFEDGKSVEVLLLRPTPDQCWEVLAKPAKPARPGRRLSLACGHLMATVAAAGINGRRVLRLPPGTDLRAILDSYGVMPLPPYIKRRAESRETRAETDIAARGSRLGAPDSGLSALGSRLSALDWERYQTVYAQAEGAVAAPTAGLHFTAALLDRIRRLGVLVHSLTLHVGVGTFQPVRVEDIPRHRMAPEQYAIPEETAHAIKAAKAEGRRVIAVGTTSVRALEHAADDGGAVRAGEAEADLFIIPGYRFRVADALLTNFHLPRSTLLMLVSAFAGLATIRRAYTEAIAQRYRFYSYGDATLIL